MQDYAGNSRKQQTAEGKPEKVVQKVVTETVLVKKKGLGRKIKDLFIEADFRSVMRYVASDVFIPAARNMIVESATKGVERMMYGESGFRRGPGRPGTPRITYTPYNNPISRGPGPARQAPMPSAGPRRREQDEFLFSSREEAELVLEQLNNIIDTYEVASVGDLHELVGASTSHVDQKWGWIYLADVRVRQTRDGFVLDLPPAEPINQ